MTYGTYNISGDKDPNKFRVPVVPDQVYDTYQQEYSSILTDELYQSIQIDPAKLRPQPKGIEKLRRYGGRVPSFWPIPVSVTCSFPLYVHYKSILSCNQYTSASDLLNICRYIANMVDVYAVELQSDAWRQALKAVSAHCFTRVFTMGPAYMLFTHLHFLTAKAPYTRDQVLNDVTSWVSAKIGDEEKKLDPDVTERVLDRVFTNWYSGESFGSLTYEQFANDFMRWGTSGGAPKIEYMKTQYRSKWAWAIYHSTHHGSGDLRPNRNLARQAGREKKTSTIALKEEPSKTREVITTPMESYLRQAYLMYRWGKPRIPSPISSGNWLATFEKILPRWFGSIDGERFDHSVPREFIVAVIKRLGQLDPECAAVAEAELADLEQLHVKWGEDVWAWEGGLLSGWRLTSVIGSLVSACAAEYIIEATKTAGALLYGVMGDDLILYSYTASITSEDMVRAYKAFGLSANLHKTTSGPIGEFLRRVHSAGGVWAYPALGLRSVVYANPWIDHYTYEEEAEVSEAWLSYLSRLLPHSLNKPKTCSAVLSMLRSNLTSLFGRMDWDSWLSTPVSAGGGGSSEFSKPAKWCYLDKVVPTETIPEREFMAAALGVTPYKKMLKTNPCMRKLDLNMLKEKYVETMGKVTSAPDTMFKHEVSITETIYGFLFGRLRLKQLNSALVYPLPRGLRTTSPRRVIDFLLRGVKTYSGITTIQHTKDTSSAHASLGQYFARMIGTSKRFANIRYVPAVVTLYISDILRTTLSVFGTW